MFMQAWKYTVILKNINYYKMAKKDREKFLRNQLISYHEEILKDKTLNKIQVNRIKQRLEKLQNEDVL